MLSACPVVRTNFGPQISTSIISTSYNSTNPGNTYFALNTESDFTLSIISIEIIASSPGNLTFQVSKEKLAWFYISVYEESVSILDS